MTKDERKRLAIKHNNMCMREYKSLIEQSIENTHVFRGPLEVSKPTKKTNLKVFYGGSFDALKYFEYPTILNFASYKNPGGGFLNGSNAQEEQLCQQSTLYPVLHALHREYDKNQQHLNCSLYTDVAFYTPNIKYTPTGKMCSILSCPAPNVGAYLKNTRDNDSATTIHKTLTQRIRFMRSVCEKVGVETFVTGAWGCGVFKNDLKEVTELFCETFTNSALERVIFMAVDDASYEIMSDIVSKF